MEFSDAAWLDRYLAGEISDEEVRAIAAEIDPEIHVQIRALRKGVTEPAGTLPSFNVPIRTAAIVEHSVRAARRRRRQAVSVIDVPPPPTGQIPGPVHRRVRPWIAGLVAACTIVVAGLSMQQFGLSASNVRDIETEMASAKVYRTGNGQRVTITLPDRSTVLLGPASTLSVAPAYAVSGRTVSVSGEGYFVVQPDPTRPFLVNAGGSVIRVLGTTFTVRKYATDTQVRVAVTDGRVSLRSRNVAQRGEAILSRGTLGVATDSGPIVVRSDILMDDYTAWTSGELVFRDTPLREAVAQIERQYDVTVRFSDSTLYNKPFNARFGQEPVEQILDAIAIAFNSRYTRSGPNGRVITFSRAAIIRRSPAPAHLPIFPPEEVRYGR